MDHPAILQREDHDPFGVEGLPPYRPAAVIPQRDDLIALRDEIARLEAVERQRPTQNREKLCDLCLAMALAGVRHVRPRASYRLPRHLRRPPAEPRPDVATAQPSL